jgi:methanogenic corrinoid protein MtbC1
MRVTRVVHRAQLRTLGATISTVPTDRLQQEPNDCALAVVTELQRAAARPASARAGGDDLGELLRLIQAHDASGYREAMQQRLARGGLLRFVHDTVAPLTRRVGEAWEDGSFAVFEEHLFTESLQVVLRNAISTIPEPARQPRVLLTTIPQESHGLGLLMAEAILALEGCRCVSLGVQTPVWDIVLAANAHRSDVVALSFSAVANPNHVVDSLTELREKLPAATEIWAGGHCPILQRRPPGQVTVLADLRDIQPALRRWRDAHRDA